MEVVKNKKGKISLQKLTPLDWEFMREAVIMFIKELDVNYVEDILICCILSELFLQKNNSVLLSSLPQKIALKNYQIIALQRVLLAQDESPYYKAIGQELFSHFYHKVINNRLIQ